MTIHSRVLRILGLIIVTALGQPALSAPKDPIGVPDFTKGAKIPKDAKHDWNLGPTGLRGWIYCDKMVTTDARQVLITKVDKGSPAEGLFQVGDVILGVGGKPFSYDPRTELGKALTVAESKTGEGKLALSRWRAGKTEEVVLQLPVLGSYSATAPFDCAKSKLLLEQGCKALAARLAKPAYADLDPIPRSLNALALLASGNADYLPLVKKEAQWAAGYSTKSMQTWYYGYCITLLSEYVIATGDESVLPGLKRLALEAAKGQSAVGSWGHGFAIPDGRLGGYGMMNSPGLVLTISLVMAREAGVKDEEVARAIELSAKLLRFYVGKGAIPYGDHHPWIETHDDNGKCGMAAVLFNLLGEAKAAEFYSRMSVASHGAERDCGHTGNYFNVLWALPGVAQSGPNATGAWMKEFGSWYFDLARRWDGSYAHQGPPENEEDSYEGWESTGGYLLAYAMPLKKIRLTGSGKSVVKRLDDAASEALVADGRGWNNKDRNSAYDKIDTDQLLERLGSWSPVVRERAAMALARRKQAPIAALQKMLESPSLEARYGACQALIALGQRGAPAVETLSKSLMDQDLWLRIKAAEALAKIGPSAKPVVPKLLELLADVDKVHDPRGMQQRYLTFALFDAEEGGMLSGSLDGVDREALNKAVRAGLKNQDGRARGSIGSVYKNLSAKDIKPLLPAIYQAILEPSPSGEMFADTIRVEGLRLFSKHRVQEGIQACVQYTRTQNPWESQLRTPELMKVLLSYGTHAKAVIPELTKIANYFEKDEPDFPPELMKRKAKSVRDTIRAIEASKETPELIRLGKESGADVPKTDPAKAVGASAEPTTPNIVYILTDDLGYGDLGCYNPASKIPTPNLDRLAKEGVRFTDAHSPSAVCTPTRYALLTGRYAWRTRLQRNVIGPFSQPLIAEKQLTVPALLRENGYATACIGKWHLGWGWPKPGDGDKRDFTKPIPDGPTARGFDLYFGTDVPNYPPYCFIENDRTVGLPTEAATVGRDSFNIAGPMIPGWKLVDVLPGLEKRAVGFIEKAAKSDKPFFLYLPLTSPHFPVVPSPEFKGKSKAGSYGDFVMQTDHVVGEVLDALKRCGVSENTLVILTSDNGPEVSGEVNPGVYDRLKQFEHASMGALRGAKRDTWEGGHRVPFLARWPGKILAGATCDETICHVDLMATLAALLKVKLPVDAGVDSVNILPALLGEKRKTPLREATVHHSGQGNFAIRRGDWVLILAPTGDDNRKQGEPPWFRKDRGYEAHAEPGELYNLAADPTQKKNLYSAETAKVHELATLLERYVTEGRSTPGSKQKNDADIAWDKRLK